MAIGADFVSFVWAAGGASSDENGGGATRAAWDAGAVTDFMSGTGGPTSDATTFAGDETACNVVEGGGDSVKVVAPNADDFDDCVTDTIAFISFSDTIGLNGHYTVTRIDDDEMTIDGLTYSGDLSGVDETCDINVGGASNSIVSVSSTDLTDASSFNCDVLIKGDETTNADINVTAGGGTDTTLLQFIGVDANWDEIALTATSGWPILTMGAFTWRFNDDAITVKGMSVTGSDPTYTIYGGVQFLSLISCTIVNTGTGRALQVAGGSSVILNCSAEANNTTEVINVVYCNVVGCSVKQTSTGKGIFATAAFRSINVIGNIVHSTGNGSDGIFIDRLDTVSTGSAVIFNTVDNWDDCIHMDELPDVEADLGSLLIANNILSDWDTYGINKTDADDQGPVIINNAFWDAQTTGNPTNLGNMPVLLSITLTGDPYTTRGTDYSLDNTAGQGAACRAAAFPGAHVDGNNTGYGDVGALQHEDAGGAGEGWW